VDGEILVADGAAAVDGVGEEEVLAGLAAVRVAGAGQEEVGRKASRGGRGRWKQS